MSQPMLCPRCAKVMNHHADKIVYAELGEHIEEFYQCSDCGASANRRAEEQDAVDAS